MADATPPAATPSAPAEKPVVNVDSGPGAFSLDEFERVAGIKHEPDEVDEPEEHEHVELQNADDKKKGKKPAALTPKEGPSDVDEEDEAGDGEGEPDKGDATDEDDEQEDDGKAEEELGKLGAGVKKGIKAITKDGKEVTLPDDLIIEKMVDGELQKINLKEHLDVVAGELTVNQRLGKVASLREHVETRRKEVEAKVEQFDTNIKSLLEHCKDNKPEMALAFLAELQGESPVQYYRTFLNNIVAAAAKFEGKSDKEIENQFLLWELQWRDKKQTKETERTARRKGAQEFVERVTTALKDNGIDGNEFTAVSAEMKEAGELEGKKPDEQVAAIIAEIQSRGVTKKVNAVLDKVNPKLKDNQKLVELVTLQAETNNFTEEELTDVVKEVLSSESKRIASNLSKRATGQVTTTGRPPEKKGEAGQKKTFTSVADMTRSFGLGS